MCNVQTVLTLSAKSWEFLTWCSGDLSINAAADCFGGNAFLIEPDDFVDTWNAFTRVESLVKFSANRFGFLQDLC